MSQRLPSESLRFTKIWAKVPPKCLQGCPLSHLGSPRSGPRYLLNVSKVATRLLTKRFVEGGGYHALRNLFAFLINGLRHLANPSLDFNCFSLLTISGTLKPLKSDP